MKGKGLVVSVVVLTLLLSMVPLYTVSATEVSSNTTVSANETVTTATNVTNTVDGMEPYENETENESLKIVAEAMLKNLERLRNITVSLINESQNVSDTVMELYERALNLSEEARALYENGSYKESIHTSIMAMRLYKDVIKALRTGKEEPGMPELVAAKVEALRMNGYFKHVEFILKAAEEQGIDVGNITLLYNETREAYKKVVIDVTSKNTTALKSDLQRARELKRELDEAIRELHIKFVLKKADKISLMFEKKLEIQIRALERLERVPGINASAIESIRKQLEELRTQVQNLTQQGRYLDAIKLIRESTPKLLISAVHLRWIEKKDMIRWPEHGPGGGNMWKGRGHGKGSGKGHRP